MKEQLITFETAKLAKEKGFNLEINTYYSVKKESRSNTTFFNYNQIYNLTSAPTQSLLQKWLREKHNLHIEIHYMDELLKYGFQITNIKLNQILLDFFIYSFNTYEEALEAGLQEGLKIN